MGENYTINKICSFDGNFLHYLNRFVKNKYITHKENNVMSFLFPARVIWEPYFKFVYF